MIKSKANRFEQPKSGKRKSNNSASRQSEMRRELEDRIRRKLASYLAIEHLDKEWGAAVESGAAEFDLRKAKQFQSLYEDWARDTDAILKSIRRMEAKGVRVAGALDFRDTVGFCPAGIDVEKMIDTFERLERGEGVVFSEVDGGKVHPRRHS
jgi:hypothetical protein